MACPTIMPEDKPPPLPYCDPNPPLYSVLDEQILSPLNPIYSVIYASFFFGRISPEEALSAHKAARDVDPRLA
jgi:hypothetical protein